MNEKFKKFQRTVKDFARRERRDFPWRKTRNPYRILVSEIMLQQTQTDRVVGYYREFLKRFPTLKALSTAPLADVIAAWQGLGYNRRARFLWQLARVVTRDHHGRLPRDAETLLLLPGIGSYTANAVCVFAYDTPLPMIETNIRVVFIRHFFSRRKTPIHDRELLPFVERTMDRRNPREWFYALMDYGSALKKDHRELNKRSAHYVRQARFIGSRRQLRGIILKHLVRHGTISAHEICAQSTFAMRDIRAALEALCRESMVKRAGQQYRLSNQ